MRRAWLYLMLSGFSVAKLAAAPPEEGIVYKTLDEAMEFPYALYVPPGVQKDKTYPLIVALHGARGNTDGPIHWWRRVAAERGYFICAPKSRGPSWPFGEQDHVHRIVTEVRRDWPVDGKRILLTGVSDGGTFSYVIGFGRPELYAALAPISGVLPRFYDDLGTLPKLPICIVHGTADETFPVVSARQAVERLKEAKYNVTYMEIALGGHGFFAAKAGDILEWFEALSSPPSPEKKKERRLRQRVEEFHSAELLGDFRRMAPLIRARDGEVTAETLRDSQGDARQVTSELRKIEAAGDTATVEVFKRYAPPMANRTGVSTEKWIWINDDWFFQW